PSMRMKDLAKAIMPNAQIKHIGIRPGEKMHEVMCPAELSGNTVEFKDHYVIEPAFYFQSRPEYTTNALGEHGTRVAPGFEYNSLNNTDFLSVPQLHALIGETPTED
ncbi:MAG: polysaccharide biosynthesis protein, partial [Rickettsiales bacterium]|nr:polysaccharide biosynthesis protein [Rickettsiales bacterium]